MESVCELPIKAMDIEPEPGKIGKFSERREEIVYNQSEALKLFEHF
jgi:hypothetical protein